MVVYELWLGQKQCQTKKNLARDDELHQVLVNCEIKSHRLQFLMICLKAKILPYDDLHRVSYLLLKSMNSMWIDAELYLLLIQHRQKVLKYKKS